MNDVIRLDDKRSQFVGVAVCLNCRDSKMVCVAQTAMQLPTEIECNKCLNKESLFVANADLIFINLGNDEIKEWRDI